MNSYIRLIRFLIPHWRIMLVAAFCMFFVSIFENISITAVIPFVDKVIAGKEIVIANSRWTPYFVENFIAKINSLSRGELLTQISLWLVILYFFKEIFVYGQAYLMVDISQRVVRDVRVMLCQKLVDLPLGFYAKRKHGELISRITYDTNVIKSTVSEGLTDLISQSLQLIVGIVILITIKQSFAIDNKLVIYGGVVLPLVVYPVLVFAKRVRKLSRLSQEKMGDINSILFEAISGINTVKGFLLEKFKVSKFKAQNQHFYRYILKSNKRIKAISPLTEFVGVVSCSIILWIGGKEVVEGTLSPGALIAFLSGVLLLLRPFKKLSGIHNVNQQALSAVDRIYEILEERDEQEIKEQKNAIELVDFGEQIEFKNVNFKYREEFVLNDVSFKVKKGEKVAIVGPSGAGKSTLLNLIPRFYEPLSGEITLDGQSLDSIKLTSLRKQIGIVYQDNVLFNGTIKENIAYGLVGNEGRLFTEDKKQFDDLEEKILEVSKIAHAHEFIMNFSQQYETSIGDRGATLSGGERQRIAIARALLKNPPILILDEATSQLDAESEKLVQDALQVLMKGRTVLVIAHRFSTIREIEKIVVLEQGRISAIGKHQELMKSSPTYHKLYQMQFEGN